MHERLKYHFEPQKGWMNDPNGLVYFKGKYHIFFQHNPYDNKWGKMHWGHAISDDLIHFEELDIALYPDQDYENSGGCFSGSAIVKDDILYLFYTSVSNELKQTISLAYSRDGISFTKYEKNPIIYGKELDFRDPKISIINDEYMMVIGSGKDGIGKVYCYKSNDLLNWNYDSILLEGKEYGSVIECPDFFKLDDKYVLMYSHIEKRKTYFVCGKYENSVFCVDDIFSFEQGPDFYAAQTFLHQNRRIMIGWMYNWERKTNLDYAGALSIPREVKIINGKIGNYPIKEAWPLLREKDEFVNINNNAITINGKTYEYGRIMNVTILRDTKTVEVFINEGEYSVTSWIDVY